MTNETFICTMPAHAGPLYKRSISKREAGELAECITLAETGQITQAVERMRSLLRNAGYPVPAAVRGVER